MAFEPISGPGLPGNKLPFSSATRAGGFVFVSGQASVDDAGNLALDTFEKLRPWLQDKIKAQIIQNETSLPEQRGEPAFADDLSDEVPF